jgi:hypothetical protein
VLNSPEPKAAHYLAELLHTGHTDLQQFKPASIRPVAVGNDKVIVHGAAEALHHATSHAHARAVARATGHMRAFSDVSAAGWGSMFSSGSSIGASALPDGGFISPPTPLATSSGRNQGRASSASATRARGMSSARHTTTSDATSDSAGHMRGQSHARTSNESYVTRYEDRPTEFYSLPEQIHRLAGELMNLPPRHCIVKVAHHPPMRLVTVDYEPSFRSQSVRARLLPLYLAKLARSPYVRPLAEAQAEITAALAALIEPAIAEPDFAAPVRRMRVVHGADQ